MVFAKVVVLSVVVNHYYTTYLCCHAPQKGTRGMVGEIKYRW